MEFAHDGGHVGGGMVDGGQVNEKVLVVFVGRSGGWGVGWWA